MTYNDFLNQFVGVISSFRSWLVMVAENLISNYFFITFLGITIFVSLLFLFVNFLKKYTYGIIDNINYKEDLYKNYCLKQDVVWRWRNEHRLRVYQMQYDRYHLNRIVSDDWLTYNPVLSNKMYQNKYEKIVPAKIYAERKFRPDWLDRDPAIQPLSPEEQKVLDDIIDNF